jgi:hypothetical protein
VSGGQIVTEDDILTVLYDGSLQLDMVWEDLGADPVHVAAPLAELVASGRVRYRGCKHDRHDSSCVVVRRRAAGCPVSGTYEVTVSDANGVCFTATVTPAPWTARDALELATDLARCLKPDHRVAAVAVAGARDEGHAES